METFFLGNCCKVVYYAATLCNLQSKHSKSFPKKTCSEKVSYNFSKKPLIFWKRKSKKKSLYFRKQNFLKLPETDLFYISAKVYSEPQHIQNQKHIQNLGILRTQDIFRTLSKNSTFLYFEKWNFLAQDEKSFCISEKGTFQPQE